MEKKKRPAAATGGEASKRQKGSGAAAILAPGAVAQFYSKSKDVDDLGLGRADWRKVLSNFHACEIELEGRRYSSVEHAFHAAKARCFHDSDRQNLLSVIEAAFGTFRPFNRVVSSLFAEKLSLRTTDTNDAVRV